MKTLRKVLPLLALSAFLVSGNARAGLFDDEEARKQILELSNRVKTQDELFVARLSKVEAENEQRGRAIIELSNQIDSLKNDIARLRGQLEVLLNDADASQKRQKDF